MSAARTGHAGRMLLGDEVERIAREVWPELEGARLWTVARRMADVRDTLDDLPDVPVTPGEAAKIRELALVSAFLARPPWKSWNPLGNPPRTASQAEASKMWVRNIAHPPQGAKPADVIPLETLPEGRVQ